MMYSTANARLFLLVLIVWTLVAWAILASNNRFKDNSFWNSFHYSTPYVAVLVGTVGSAALVTMYTDVNGGTTTEKTI
jgi:hypothetical protein